MWVQLRQAKQINVNGHPTPFQKGDWVEVGRQTAERWKAAGECYIPKTEAATIASLDSAGVIVTRASLKDVADKLGDFRTEVGEPACTWHKTIVWDGHASARIAMFPIGLRLLDTWEVACPLCSYDRLAISEGDEDEQARTKAIVRDLRVMLYDPRLLFVRQSEGGERLMAYWKQERGAGNNERLALLRAMYRAKPFVLALPVTWFAQ